MSEAYKTEAGMDGALRRKMEEQELLESYLLYSIRGIGPASLRKLIEHAGSAVAVKGMKEEALRELIGEKRTLALLKGMEERSRRTQTARYQALLDRGIRFLPFWCSDYPKRLKAIPDPPAAIFCRGKLPAEQRAAVAVIGARECSGYGWETARIFAAGLAAAGVTVISGMARGVDGIAQRAALEAGGNSAAVLGCGVDVCYPPENRKLYDRLIQDGCLISEYPPGTGPAARLFPPRNRIISGLSDLVLVTEAREKSGTLITVDMALEQGKEVYAVPGRITDSCSAGCNRLILNGAGMAVSVSQLLTALQENRSGLVVGGRGTVSVSPGQEAASGQKTLRNRVLAALTCMPASLEEIGERLEGGPVSVGALMEELVNLCMEGEAGSCAGMYYAQKKGGENL